ncbi:dipeptide/oligopeptide/nickel ABC transporter permease/ATP-binding protein [Azorhizobium doebereinerae]|uniref:dipeptide/oligopeptide/nickel ABC transporter permease/ATP-binding protein n=1 Tax=Azorhizobium doebereinerae TaxID=281091 RepID=UPI0003F5ED45|nr:dipeptide/oligopeptide/nickel ABC transporter permease/ATP-binding protein [Azorhizobium doebereinerae]
MSASLASPRFHRLVLPGALLALVLLTVAAAPLLPLADPVKQQVSERLSTPSLGHLLGQDEYGRDVFSRIIWGGRVSLSVSILAAACAGLIGTLLGLVGGYFRGVVELMSVRLAEVVLCFPPMLLALLVVTLLGPGAVTLVLVLTILFTPGYARVAYAETLSARTLDYVTAQTALGATSARVLFRTVLPNIAPPLLVQFSLTVAAAMMLESGLSFLGLGVVPPSPSWGLMIRSARSVMEQAPLLLLWPCLALAGTVLLLNVVCDRLRDVMDPRGAAMGVIPGFLRRARSAALPQATTEPAPSLVRIDNLTLSLKTPAGPLNVVRGVSFGVAPGETVALVGESGSGKTLTALAVMGLLPPVVTPAGGSIRFSRRDGTVADLLHLPEGQMRRLRGNDLSIIFQDPSASLNPVHRCGKQVAEAIRAHGGGMTGEGSARAAKAKVVALFRRVGLPDPERRAGAFPHELSGGQKQRVMIAAAVANTPRLLIADEPTTALDVTVQAQILDLLADLKGESGSGRGQEGKDTEGKDTTGMGLLFVTHNLAVVRQIADKVVVMYAGEVVEEGPVAEVFARPRHPYTAALLASAPESEAEELTAIPGTVPSPAALPPGCRFAPRCGFATPACDSTPPASIEVAPGRIARCIRWMEVA